MRDLIVIFIILLVLLILISTFGGSIRYTPTWKSEKFEESTEMPSTEEVTPPEGVQLGAMPSDPETFMTVGAPSDMKPPMEVGAPEGNASSYPTKEAGAALDLGAAKTPAEEETIVEPFSGEAFAAACSSCTGCA